ncbi:MAG TPA: ribonuclease HI family protein [Candidatus Saccharimonadales bacterium]|nr:ribonuclease HI family protein [Candidatus Saccharimonadales bacterium]
MKTLKLDHNLAQQVVQGTMTSTWRMYDDKNISVNDVIEVIDKVDPKNPDTWLVVANATVDEVVEKRLSDVKINDNKGHREYESQEQMLQEFQRYYGPQVDLNTPIKLISFTLTNVKVSGIARPQTLAEAKLYADGGSRGNPGPSASGFVILDMDDNVVLRRGEYLGVTTNNQAEYQALRLGLEQAKKMGIRELHVFMDSLLVVNQMRGIFKVKNRDLWPIHDATSLLSKEFRRVTFSHVPRELNKLADAQVNEALDATAARQ